MLRRGISPGREANLMKSRKMRQFSISQMKEFDDSKQTGNLRGGGFDAAPRGHAELKI